MCESFKFTRNSAYFLVAASEPDADRYNENFSIILATPP